MVLFESIFELCEANFDFDRVFEYNMQLELRFEFFETRPVVDKQFAPEFYVDGLSLQDRDGLRLFIADAKLICLFR